MIREFQLGAEGGGGFVMWFLLVCAVIGIGLILERLFSLFIKARLNPRTFLEKLTSTVDSQGIDAGIALCDQTAAPVAKILRAVLEKAHQGKDAMEEMVARSAAIELAFLDRGMALLSGLTTVSPFLGFLGTVMGMITAFAAIAMAGEVEPTIVASGISTALITTKWGLIIATPLAIIHILFSSKVDGYTRDMEEAASGLIDYLIEQYPKRKK
ncbi:MAG TPA: MotA/TolQ/ExbB proton channel family protein [candidate division WOR-3 bacterium]|uniref:MotA/TolQ/ExbB proton channel family protein n=1 Tax=candidate division WOR-3 bacterium TaxID=2052148 RepID=A0A9C9JZL5_UNCW3|nr:MotA/TolQ/ExbB proton channel family protein [candidate division WOR-3 bacterium]